jgi:hypothetical protein
MQFYLIDNFISDIMQTNPTSNIVFNCLKCNLIIGDSTSIQECNENLQVIILNSVSNIQKSTSIITSKSGIDIGSTYFNINCKGCKVCN